MDTTTTPHSPTPIRIKGVGDSLWVTLDPETPLAILQEGLRQRFEQMKNLAANARVIIDTGSPDAHRGLVSQLGDFLKATFPVASVAAPPKERPPIVDQAPRIRQRDMSRSWQHHRSDVLMLTGRVRSGQKVTARKHLLILGDVNPGGEVVAGGVRLRSDSPGPAGAFPLPGSPRLRSASAAGSVAPLECFSGWIRPRSMGTGETVKASAAESHRVNAQNTWHIEEMEVFFDGDCPICSREISFLLRHQRLQGIGHEQAGPGVEQEKEPGCQRGAAQ